MSPELLFRNADLYTTMRGNLSYDTAMPITQSAAQCQQGDALCCDVSEINQTFPVVLVLCSERKEVYFFIFKISFV